MPKQLLSGTSVETLDYHLMEFFGPGEQVQVILGVDTELNDEQLARVTSNLNNLGLDVRKVQLGSTPDWPNAVQIVFRRPMRARGYALIPIATALRNSFAVAGINRFTGWRML
jgi:hypothetical protein